MRRRRSSGVARPLREEEGQMVVELAALMPAMLVIAVVVVNLMWFLEAAALFERVVPDAVIAMAVSPVGEDVGSSQEHAVAQAIEQAMGGVRGVSVSVRAEYAWEDAEGILGFSFAPHLTRYVCTMTYAPWPASFSIAGFDAGMPLVLQRERSFTVDRYRPGVLF